MTDDGDLRAVVLGAIAMLEAERDEAIARAEAAEACAKESAEIMYRQRDRLEAARDPLAGWRAAREAAASKAVIKRLEDEVASLRLTLGGRTFSDQPVPDPVGCPLPGACVQVAEITRLREALKEIVEFKPARATMAAWEEIDRLREIAKAALKGDGS